MCGSRTCFLFLFPADFIPVRSAGFAEILFEPRITAPEKELQDPILFFFFFFFVDKLTKPSCEAQPCG